VEKSKRARALRIRSLTRTPGLISL